MVFFFLLASTRSSPRGRLMVHIFWFKNALCQRRDTPKPIGCDPPSNKTQLSALAAIAADGFLCSLVLI